MLKTYDSTTYFGTSIYARNSYSLSFNYFIDNPAVFSCQTVVMSCSVISKCVSCLLLFQEKLAMVLL